MKASIKSFINYRPPVGTEGLLITGLPGTGKSNMAAFVASLCMARGEVMLTHGDLSCEWRHYYNYDKVVKEIRVLYPKELDDNDEWDEDNLFNIPPVARRDIKPVDFSTLDINSHLAKHRLTVVYDEAYDIGSKAWLWVDIFKQILGRKSEDLILTPIIYLVHEAGVVWPEQALSESKLARNHWWAVNTFAEMFVFFRKRLVRPILISQLPGEIKWQIRKKCMIHIMRQGPCEKAAPYKLRRDTARLPIHKYNIQAGGPDGLYDRGLIAKKFKEAKKIWLMIPPPNPITYEGNGHDGQRQPDLYTHEEMIILQGVTLGKSDAAILRDLKAEGYIYKARGTIWAKRKKLEEKHEIWEIFKDNQRKSVSRQRMPGLS